MNTLTYHRLTHPDDPAYPEAERLLTTSFPRDEYRELEAWRTLMGTDPRFHAVLVGEGETVVALLTYWDFGTFRYVEHLAVSPALRGQGYGSRILQHLTTTVPTPLILEVELPLTDASRRRIAFYRRQGFVLWQTAYVQPPYRPGDASLPMHLMAYGFQDEARAEEVKGVIYKEVYGVDED